MPRTGPSQRHIFQQRLAEAIAWCAPLVVPLRPKWCLRTPRLEPRGSVVGAASPERDALVSDLCRERARLLQQGGVAPTPSAGAPGAGRLLLFYASDSLCDGTAEAASEGYFDHENQPPWDTWVHFLIEPPTSPEDTESSVVVSWVPPDFVALVERAIEQNPEQCLAWASPANLPLLW